MNGTARKQQRPASVSLNHKRKTEAQMKADIDAFAEDMKSRRSIRNFSDESVPLHVVRRAVEIAGTAPSGAHKQPWTYVVITDPDVKKRIREAAEFEERRFYTERAPDDWLDDLKPFGTTWRKPMLEDAPVLVAVFARVHSADDTKHYYVKESVGISVGMFLAALHVGGLCALTHTPSPMRFLGEILERPEYERPYLLIPVGYPVDGCEVPNLKRQPLEEFLIEK